MADSLLIEQTTKKYLDGTISPVQITRRELEKLKVVNRMFNAVRYMFDEKEILQKAKESEERYKRGKPLGPFDGIPVTFKDCMQIKGYRATLSSWFLKNGFFKIMDFYGGEAPTESAGCIKMLQDSGAIPLCVTSCPELCCSDTGNSFLHGNTINPRNPMKVPGGSSSGAAVLSATQVGYINMGSDGLGSIRIPAAYCGCYGFKPSYSIGVKGPDDVPHFPYMGVNGPLSSNMENIILYMQTLQKYTKKLKHCDLSNENIKNISSIKNLKIAVSKDLAGTVDYVNADIWDNVLKVADKLKQLGATVEFIDPALNECPRSVVEIGWVLFSTFFADFGQKVKEFKNGEYAKLVNKWTMYFTDSGSNLTAEQLKNAVLEGDVIRATMNKFMNDYDLLLTPTSPILPLDSVCFHDDGFMIDKVDGKKKTLDKCKHNAFAFTALGNITKQPAVVIPTGFVNDNKLNQGKIPTSAMFYGAVDRDDLCLKVAYALQNAFKFIPAKL